MFVIPRRPLPTPAAARISSRSLPRGRDAADVKSVQVTIEGELLYEAFRVPSEQPDAVGAIRLYLSRSYCYLALT